MQGHVGVYQLRHRFETGRLFPNCGITGSGGGGVTLHPTIGTDTKVAKPRIVYSYKKKSAPITHLEWTADGCSQLLAVNAKGRVRNRQVPLRSRRFAHDLALSRVLSPP